MNQALLIRFFFLFWPFDIDDQSFTLIKSLEIAQPTEVSIDRGGNIYFATFDGDIIKLNSQLEQQQTFSPPNPNYTQILDAWQGLRIFTFHRDLQKFRLINRNLSLHEDYLFPVQQIGFVELATPSFDNNIWLIDQSDFSLKKYLIHNQEIGSNTPLQLLLNPSNYELLHCQEYQNRLFISTRGKGILIFDNFGTYLKTFNYPGIGYFNFNNDDIYFIRDNKLVSINLYDETMTSIELPSDDKWLFALVFEKSTYLFSNKYLYLYQ
jgi:hypothetical protein